MFFATVEAFQKVPCFATGWYLSRFLAANLVACFMELRFTLESLVKCYWADIMYSEQTFFPRMAKLMRKSGKDFVVLWGKLSEE